MNSDQLPYHIYIPTRGRVDKQLTVEKLPEALHPCITLVCPKPEWSALAKNYPSVTVVTQPDKIQNLSDKRAWIAEYAAKQKHPFWFQMDDDLKFFVWDGSKHTSLINAPKAAKKFFLTTLPHLVAKYKCVGFGTKGFALPGGLRINYHLGFVFGFEPKTALECIEWGRVRFYEDIDYTLQVLKSGVDIAITYDVVVEQRKADAEGGISGERTVKLAEVALDKLIELHPGLIKRKPPSAQHPYSNTLVSWKGAAAMGKSKSTKTLF